MTITVRPVAERDAVAWADLYDGYRAFYGQQPEPEVVARAWRWVARGEHAMTGLVAVDANDRPVALANLRWFARASEGELGLYLDDLFTAPAARGTGAGSALLQAAAELAAARGATVVRWITATDNAAARRLYDAHATATAWVTYDMPPAAPTPPATEP